MAVTEPLNDRPPRRWLRRLLVGLLVGVLLLGLVGAGLAAWSVWRPFPQTSGAVTVRGLDGPVEVHRDSLGVPTIVATTSRDLIRGLGFVHAQDRFWQMDTWRHIGRGRTAELFGADQLPTDRFLRTLGWERIAEAELDLLDADALAMLEDYAAGVNAYIEDRPARALGFEYTLLGLTGPGYRPAAWEPIDSLVFLKIMAWDLRDNLRNDIERGVLAQTLSDEQLADLYPSYEHAPVIVPDYGPAGEAYTAAGDEPVLTGLLERTLDAAETVPRLSPAGADGIGSNSWVVGGSHTETGLPILANDPHLGIQMPSIWYQASLRCAARTDACVDDVAGFTFAGLPGVIIGHNGQIAWGLTNLGQDAVDLFVERINPEDPHQYEVNGEWVDLEVETETLAAAGGETETLEIRRTRNGPIISDVFEPVDDLDPAAVDDEAGGPYAIALRWTALEPRRTFQTLPLLNRARDWDEFRAALEHFAAPGQNLVYADAEGSIGYQATGVVPLRASGDGQLPVPGWVDDFQWVGSVAYDDMPSLRDPDDDLIVAANNPIVGADYPHHISSDWDHGQRAARIDELLADAERPLTLDDVHRQQLDTHQHAADWLVPALLAADSADAGDEADARRAARAQELLAGWDHRMDADSTGAAVFAATWRHLLAGMFHADLPERFHPAGGTRWFEVVRRLLDRPDADWWDMPGTGRTENRDVALAVAAAAGIAELEEHAGDDAEAWAWGELHTATFRNQTLGQSGIGVVESRLNRGPYPVGGSTSIVNAVGWNAALGYEVTWLPSMRMIVDLDDVDRSRGIHTTGQSGHAYHEHYTSMIDAWLEGGQYSLRWDLSAIAAEAQDVLRLRP